MKLHYQILGSTNNEPLVILHGLFGSLVNWRKIGQELTQHTQVILVDLRNHGRSPHSDEISYQLMAEDLLVLLDDLNIETINLIGHSVGGKVAMAFSELYPQKLNKLVVVDISPKQYCNGDSTPIFDALLAIDLSLYSSRSEVDKALSNTIKDKLMRLFLLMNLDTNNGELSWRINLKPLHLSYPTLLMPVCEDATITTPTCFIRGKQSDYITDQDRDLLSKTFVNSTLVDIENAGHWVHADAPQAFIGVVTDFFDYD